MNEHIIYDDLHVQALFTLPERERDVVELKTTPNRVYQPAQKLSHPVSKIQANHNF